MTVLNPVSIHAYQPEGPDGPIITVGNYRVLGLKAVQLQVSTEVDANGNQVNWVPYPVTPLPAGTSFWSTTLGQIGQAGVYRLVIPDP